MNQYRLFVNGRNFFVRLEEEPGRYGFFQHIHLAAATAEQAEEAAVQQVRNDPELRELTSNPQNDPPLIFVEEIVELADAGELEPTASGRAWYREKRWWEFWKIGR